MTEATATPEGAPVSEDTSLEAVMAKLDAEQDAETQPEPTEAEQSPAGDAEQAPEPDDEAAPADDAEQAEDAAEPSPLPATVKVKVNGEELEVPLDEALKGYSRTEDYKAKTAALAEEGRALRGQYATQLQTMAERLLSFDPILAQAAQTDWAVLAREDPAEYVAMKESVAQRQQALAQIEAEVARARDIENRETMQREFNALVSAMPQLADPDTAAKYDADLRTYLKSSMKFDDATINDVADHRFYLLAEKARQFDAMQAAKASLPAKIVPPARSAVPPVKSGNAEAARPSPRKPSANAPMREQLAWLARNV